MNKPKNQKGISRYVKLEDYKVFDYEIPEIFLDFVIKKNAVNVTTKLKLVKKNKILYSKAAGLNKPVIYVGS